MFVHSPQPRTNADLTRDDAKDSLVILAERVRPTSSSETRLLPVATPLAGLLPDGGLRRGSSIVVTGGTLDGRDGSTGGGVTLALALFGAASEAGSWCTVVGLPGLGAVAASDLGIDLARMALVPHPGPEWAQVTAAALDGTDLVLLRPPFPPRPSMARQLIARARDRRSILVVIPGRGGWPECPDVHLSVDRIRWDGIGDGDGYLHRRQVTVTATGRRSAARPRRRRLWLPSPSGKVEGVAGPGADAEPGY